MSAAQLASATFVAGPSGATDQLWVRAFDGTDWSDWVEFHADVPANHAPVVATGDTSLGLNQSVAASSLFTVFDADRTAITKFQFWDDNATAGTADDHPAVDTSGHFVVNGQTQTTGQAIDVLASDLASASYVAGATEGGTDLLWVRAFDGASWSDWQPFTVLAHA